MATITAVMSLKGGVGKTTVAINLAATLADTKTTTNGTPVLGVSTDPQGSMLEWCDRAGDSLNFDFEQCSDNPELLAQLKRIDQYDDIFLDTAGSVDDPDTVNVVLGQADLVILVMQPVMMSYTPTEQMIEQFIEPAGVPYRVVINNWDPRDGRANRDQTIEHCDRKGWPRFETVIRHYKLHEQAPALGATVLNYPKSRVALEARQDFLKLNLEVMAAKAEGTPRHAGGNAVTAVGEA